MWLFIWSSLFSQVTCVLVSRIKKDLLKIKCIVVQDLTVSYSLLSNPSHLCTGIQNKKGFTKNKMYCGTGFDSKLQLTVKSFSTMLLYILRACKFGKK